MLQVHVVKASTSNTLQTKINEFLEDLPEKEFVDIKFAGANDGKDETFAAIIIYRN